MDKYSTFYSIINHLKDNVKKDKISNASSPPTLSSVYEYLEKEPFIIENQNMILNTANQSYYVDFELSEYMKLIEGMNGDVYVDPFASFLKRGYTRLVATTIYTLSPTCSFWEQMIIMSQQLGLECKRITIVNDVFIEIGDSVIFFTSYANTKSFLRTACKSPPPLLQVYMFLKLSDFKYEQIGSAVIETLAIGGGESNIVIVNREPFEVDRLECIKSSIILNGSQLKQNVVQQTMKQSEHRIIYYGQCFNKDITSNDLITLVKNKRIPKCCVWKRVILDGETEPDKILLLIVFNESTLMSTFSLLVQKNSAIPKCIRHSIIGNSILFRHDIRDVDRIFPRLYIYKKTFPIFTSKLLESHVGTHANLSSFKKFTTFSSRDIESILKSIFDTIPIYKTTIILVQSLQIHLQEYVIGQMKVYVPVSNESQPLDFIKFLHFYIKDKNLLESHFQLTRDVFSTINELLNADN